MSCVAREIDVCGGASPCLVSQVHVLIAWHLLIESILCTVRGRGIDVPKGT